MPVKYWSQAGLLLTYWCNARCASCYLNCSPEGGCEMSVENAIRNWRSVIEASPHGCRIHISGGEPFGNWERLIEIARRGKSEGLGPLKKIETNAFWAADEKIIIQRIGALDEAGMEKLCISTDPYHQQFVPIENCRLLARLGREVLGPDRVQIRWEDWLAEGFDTDRISNDQRQKLFVQHATSGRDRFNGRLAETICAYIQQKSLSELADKPCREALLRSKHVHIDGSGRIFPGTCAGVILGSLEEHSASQIWSELEVCYEKRPILGTLSQHGPVGLLENAKNAGYVPGKCYTGKCHLCWDVRQYLAINGYSGGELGPMWLYDEKEIR